MSIKRLLITISTIILLFVAGIIVSYNVLAARLAANNAAIVKDEEGVLSMEIDTSPDKEGLVIISEDEYNRADDDADKDITDEEFKQAVENEYLQIVGAAGGEQNVPAGALALESGPVVAGNAENGENGDAGSGTNFGFGAGKGANDIGDDIYERVEINDRIYNILLMGDDARINEPRARSDSIILISYNRDTNNVSLTSFSRDMLVPTTVSGRPWNRINRIYGDGGPGRAINMINYIFTLDLQRYAIVRFASVFELVDQLGGLDLELKQNEAATISRIFPEYGAVKEGLNHLNGRQVLAYARMRKIDSELQRTARQRYVLRVAIEKVMDSKKISDLSTLASFALEHVDTNIPLNEIITIAYELFTRGRPTINELRLPIDNSFSYATYYGANILLFDFPTNVKALHEFIYGSADGVVITHFRKPPNMGPEPTTEAAVDEEVAGDGEATGGEAAGEAAGDGVAGADTAGGEAAGEAAGDGVAGEDAAGDGVTGGDTEGDNLTGNGAEGNNKTTDGAGAGAGDVNKFNADAGGDAGEAVETAGATDEAGAPDEAKTTRAARTTKTTDEAGETIESGAGVYDESVDMVGSTSVDKRRKAAAGDADNTAQPRQPTP